MGLTYGYLSRGTEVLFKFNSISGFPSLITQIANLDKMQIPSQAYPLVFDNGNVGGKIQLEINLINSTYDTSESWGSTGTIFEQFFEMRRVVYNSGAFLTGGKPTKTDGTKDYDSFSSYPAFYLTIYFESGDDDPFSSNFSVFTNDFIRADKKGVVFTVLPTDISLKSVNQNNTKAIVSITFEHVRSVYSFRS